MEALFKQFLGLLAAGWVHGTAYTWLVRQGMDRAVAHALALVAGGVANRAIARA